MPSKKKLVRNFVLLSILIAQNFPVFGAGEPELLAQSFPRPEIELVGEVSRGAAESFKLQSATLSIKKETATLLVQISTEGTALEHYPRPAGSMDRAPVLAYVVPTTLSPTEVGFSQTDGILALAITSHPDFDDTPLWDENGNGQTDDQDDGLYYHTHWVVLQEDTRNAGFLSVKEFTTEEAITLPPTNPGMPMFMDSPGFPVSRLGKDLLVSIPLSRISDAVNFHYDVVTAYMEVRPGGEFPLLSVYQVLDVLSGDLSLPYVPQ